MLPTCTWSRPHLRWSSLVSYAPHTHIIYSYRYRLRYQMSLCLSNNEWSVSDLHSKNYDSGCGCHDFDSTIWGRPVVVGNAHVSSVLFIHGHQISENVPSYNNNNNYQQNDDLVVTGKCLLTQRYIHIASPLSPCVYVDGNIFVRQPTQVTEDGDGGGNAMYRRRLAREGSELNKQKTMRPRCRWLRLQGLVSAEGNESSKQFIVYIIISRSKRVY